MDSKNSLLVNPQGAKVEVTLAGVLVLSSFLRGDGKQGVTHPCTPIFGPDRKHLYGLKQHGNMRNEECEVRHKGDRFIVSHTITDHGYPSGVNVEQILSVKNGVFSSEMIHTNNGDKETFLNSGEHCYFDAHQGFEGTTVNGQDITDLIKNNFDGIAINLNKKNTIKIPGKPKYILEQKGFKKAVVWVGKNPKTKDTDKTYVCIEPVEDDPFGDFFGSPASVLAQGGIRKVQFSLRLG